MEQMAGLSSRRWRLAVKTALMAALASQLNLSLFPTGFQISGSVIVLAVMAFFRAELPALGTALLASPLVILLRVVLQGDPGMSFWGRWAIYWPEAVFLLAYGALLSLYLRLLGPRRFRPVHGLALVLIDLSANLLELWVRLGSGAFSADLLSRLTGAAAARTALIFLLAWAAHSYGVYLISREEMARYRQLLLLVSQLKNEMALMEKSGNLIEGIIGRAYSLYRDLEGEQAETALLIAKDIHEVKKEYALVRRGIGEVLRDDTLGEGMGLEEIWNTIRPGLALQAREMGKEVTMTFRCRENFHTTHHFSLLSIFRNLLGNGVEAAGEDPVQITLTQEEEGGLVIFTVEDTCGGIPPEYLDQIFLPGFSTKIDGKTGSMGRGLGLSTVKDLVETQLQGSIRAESEVGGARFTIQVPAPLIKNTPRREDA